MSSISYVQKFNRLLIYGSIGLCFILPRAAWADDATHLLKTMSDYLAAQKTMSFRYQSSLEAVTPDFEKLQFVSSGTASLERPDKLRITRTGGFADVDVSFDGSTLTVHGKNLDAYAKIDAKGSVDDLLGRLMDAGVEAPGADLLSSDVFDLLMSDVTVAKHVSSAFVDGVECEYLTFRTPEIDWQIWIQAGPKTNTAALRHHQQACRPGAAIHAGDQRFQERTGRRRRFLQYRDSTSAKKVDLSELQSLDELPAPADTGEGK